MRSYQMRRFGALLTVSVAVSTLAGIAARPAAAQTVVRSGAGANAAAIQAVVDQFRADLGAPNNGNTPGSQPGGRREINWDGNGAAAPAANFGSPMTTFQNRGAVFTTSGTGFQISASDGVAGNQGAGEMFANINPQYQNIFRPFSDPKLFTSLGSNIMDVNFFVPGSNTPAFVRGFGAVFCDVDNGPTAPLADRTSLEFFNTNNVSLGTFFASAADDGLSFLGVTFTGGQQIGRVRIKMGNEALGRNDEFFDDIIFTDMVVTDDFLYSEPQAVNLIASAAPEPASVCLVLLGGIAGIARRIRRAGNA
jgi:hypothetical protein